ncbi:MAG TPA: hypothetical protein DDX91_02605, partial [Ruminococcaceae bacterium]|nr:hypothetical protein [Oscillospiraceae bacterium]
IFHKFGVLTFIEKQACILHILSKIAGLSFFDFLKQTIPMWTGSYFLPLDALVFFFAEGLGDSLPAA